MNNDLYVQMIDGVVNSALYRLMPPLYHGTDFDTVEAAAEERLALRLASEHVCAVAYELFGGDAFISDAREWESLFSPEDYCGLCNAMSIVRSAINKSPYYQYDAIYVTNNSDRALGYAARSYVYGELGVLALRLVDLAQTSSLKVPTEDDSFVAELKLLRCAAEREPRPAIAVFLGVSPDRVLFENGNPLDKCQLSIAWSSNWVSSYHLPDDVEFSDAFLLDLDEFKVFLELKEAALERVGLAASVTD